MGQYLTFKKRPNDTRTREEFMQFITEKGYEKAMTYDNEFHADFCIFSVCSEEWFIKGDLAETRLSWASTNEIFLGCMELADDLECDLYDDGLHITSATLKEFIDRFCAYREFIKRAF